MSAEFDELITLKEACKLLGGFHVATYYRGVAEGRFPKPVHPSPNISRVSKLRVLEARERILAGDDDLSWRLTKLADARIEGADA